MQITIKLERLEEVIENLKGIPGAARFVVQAASKLGLGKARTMIDRAIRGRYNIGQASVLAAIGKPRMFAVGGRLSVSGSRFALSKFPAKDQNPDGVNVSILKTHTSPYPHAFIVKGGRKLPNAKSFPIMTRWPDVGRYPIKGFIAPGSIPEMLQEKSEVLPEVENQVNATINAEITRLMPLVLSGAVRVPRWYIK
jgi:hypothetical protein